MGQAKIKLPTTPQGWAIRLSQLVKVFHELHGLDRFPIDVSAVAREFSANVFPDEPITLIEGQAFDKFEGALIPHPAQNGEWGIFYNSALSSKGRINFTLAHELGHYLLHRQFSGEPIYCAKSDMWAWDSDYGLMEAQANEFASFLLMPLDDFRAQISGLDLPNIGAFEFLRKRYEVSLTAAILKWLDITKKRAMIVVSRDGFIDWSWGSKPLFRSGVFFRARQTVIPVPDGSLASGKVTISDPANGTQLAEGVWAERESVYESTIFSEYHDMAISLLIYPDDPPRRLFRFDEEEEEDRPFDTFDQFMRNQ